MSIAKILALSWDWRKLRLRNGTRACLVREMMVPFEFIEDMIKSEALAKFTLIKD